MSWFYIFLAVVFDIIFELIFGHNMIGNISYMPGRIASFFGDELVVGAFYHGFILFFLSYYALELKPKNNILIFIILGALLVSFLIGERSNFIFGEVEGERLSPIELIQNCIFLLNAGHETTANLVGNGISILLDYPDQLDRLRSDPELIKTAVEEFLRFQSPLQIGNRKATEDVEFGAEGSKTVVPAGSFIYTAIGAANRDPEIFDEPEKVDIGRKPNPQIAFGIGKHICMGNTLGRIEGHVAIGKFIERFPNISLTSEKKYHGRARFRGLESLPVEVS